MHIVATDEQQKQEVAEAFNDLMLYRMYVTMHERRPRLMAMELHRDQHWGREAYGGEMILGGSSVQE